MGPHERGRVHRPGRGRKKLIGPAAEGRAPDPLPRAFSVSPLFEYLEVCATFGQDPTAFLDRLDGFWLAHLTAYVGIKARLK